MTCLMEVIKINKSNLSILFLLPGIIIQHSSSSACKLFYCNCSIRIARCAGHTALARIQNIFPQFAELYIFRCCTHAFSIKNCTRMWHFVAYNMQCDRHPLELYRMRMNIVVTSIIKHNDI